MRVRVVLFVVAKIDAPVRIVGVQPPSPAELAVGIDTTSSIMNVWLPERGGTECVVLPAVWVARILFGKPVPNALLGDTHNRIDATASV